MMWLLATVALVVLVAYAGPRLLRGGTIREPRPDPGADGPDADYQVEIGDELDLHGVPDREVDALVDAFLDLAVQRGWSEVKIVHGKGTGRRRGRVRVRIAQHPAVLRYGDASTPGSGWGATLVTLGAPR
jgi:dsDNA-specific endonuclease/ATPase MutS2